MVLRVEADVSPNQAKTDGAINYILIGDVGQTKEAELYKYIFFISSLLYVPVHYNYNRNSGKIANGDILIDYVTVAGSNSLRIGHVNAVRLKYLKSGLIGGENQIVVQKVIVQQANVTIAAAE